MVPSPADNYVNGKQRLKDYSLQTGFVGVDVLWFAFTWTVEISNPRICECDRVTPTAPPHLLFATVSGGERDLDLKENFWFSFMGPCTCVSESPPHSFPLARRIENSFCLYLSLQGSNEIKTVPDLMPEQIYLLPDPEAYSLLKLQTRCFRGVIVIINSSLFI